MTTAAVTANKPGYHPSEDEPFMNERQLEYFKQKLNAWKEDILRESRETLVHLQSETENHPDLADRATSETDRALELRTRDRQRKLISKIDEALRRIALSDDKLAAVLAENKQLRAEVRVLKERRDGLMNENAELVKRIKALQRKLDKLEQAA